MREIKFRGKRLDNGEWVYGSLYQEGVTACIIKDRGFAREYKQVNPDTVGQYIGLKDCNDREIYEGDIITVKGDYPRVVLWDKVSWALMPCKYYYDNHFWSMNLQHPGNDWWDEFADEMEVVGNIYDNPELIKS